MVRRDVRPVPVTAPEPDVIVTRLDQVTGTRRMTSALSSTALPEGNAAESSQNDVWNSWHRPQVALVLTDGAARVPRPPPARQRSGRRTVVRHLQPACSAGSSRRSPMRALDAVCNAPVRLSARLHGADPDAGMTTAEYAVGTSAGCGSGADKRRGPWGCARTRERPLAGPQRALSVVAFRSALVDGVASRESDRASSEVPGPWGACAARGSAASGLAVRAAKRSCAVGVAR